MKTKFVNAIRRVRAVVTNRLAPLADFEGYPTYAAGFLATSGLTLIAAGVASIFSANTGLFFAMVSSVTALMAIWHLLEDPRLHATPRHTTAEEAFLPKEEN
ncbi:hypothetical protein [Corynebacterium matruchotii]